MERKVLIFFFVQHLIFFRIFFWPKNFILRNFCYHKYVKKVRLVALKSNDVCLLLYCYIVHSNYIHVHISVFSSQHDILTSNADYAIIIMNYISDFDNSLNECMNIATCRLWKMIDVKIHLQNLTAIHGQLCCLHTRHFFRLEKKQ